MAFTTTDQHKSGASAMRVYRAEKADRVLRGMKEICDYMHVSANTVRTYAKNDNFPMYKVGGGWESSTRAIDAWKDGKSSTND